MSDIKKIKDDYINKLDQKIDLENINKLRTELFGKNGIISNEFKKMGTIPAEKRKKFAFI